MSVGEIHKKRKCVELCHRRQYLGLLGVIAALVATACCATRLMSGETASSTPSPWDDPISAEQPGAANPTTLVGSHTVQMETALDLPRAGSPDSLRVHGVDFPTILRVGVSQTLELRLASQLLQSQSLPSQSGHSTGFSDVTLGAKWSPSRGNSRGIPAVALVPAITLPTGAEAFTSHFTQLSLGGLADWNLTAALQMSLNLGESYTAGSIQQSYRWQWNGAVGLQYAPGRRWSAGGDVFALGPAGSAQGATWAVDEGVAFLAGANTQLDISAAQGLSGTDRSRSVQVGFSRRWGHRGG